MSLITIVGEKCGKEAVPRKEPIPREWKSIGVLKYAKREVPQSQKDKQVLLNNDKRSGEREKAKR